MEQFITHYQSANLSDDEIKAHFIVRQKEFARIMADIRGTPDGKSSQHYVVVGRRGSGKSTLLRRIQAEICTDEDLSRRFIAVNLSEEQAGVYRLHDLWDHVLRDLHAQGHATPELDWRAYEDDLTAYSKALYAAVQDCLRAEGKCLVLMLDNIDRIFRSIGEEAALFREQLMNHNDVRIIGGSAIMSEQYWKYDLPFYQFFAIKRLGPLTFEEIGQLLNHWAQVRRQPEIAELIHTQPGKIHAVRILTDGTPRTMQLFVEMLINRPSQSGYDYLRRIIDHTTPIYQERLATLSPQQQKICVELSFFWEAATIEQLIPVCKMPGKTISAQLNVLVDRRIIEKIPGEKRSFHYRLEERFFNLWLLMTQGGPRKKRDVKYLTAFLEAWHAPEELRSVYAEFLEGLMRGRLRPDYAASMGKALAHSKHITLLERDALIDLVGAYPGMAREWLEMMPEKWKEVLPKAMKLIEEGRTESAFKLVAGIEQRSAGPYIFLFLCSLDIGKPAEAERWMNAASDCEDFPRSVFDIIVHAYLDNTKIDGPYEVIQHPLVQPVLEYIARSNLAIIFLWLGEMERFQVLHKAVVSDWSSGSKHVRFDYYLALLIHKQYSLASQLIDLHVDDDEVDAEKRLMKFVFDNVDPEKEIDQRAISEEILEAIAPVVAHIKERQEFYYPRK